MNAPPFHTRQDWIEWSGGERPVDGLRLVEVMFLDGATDTDVADAYDWQHDGLSSDVAAYRVVQP